MRRPKKEPGIFSVSKNEESIISPDIPQENVLSLRKRIFSIQINLDKIHSFFRDHYKSFGIIVGVLAGLVIAVGAFKTSAQLATFYPANCLGGWENPAGAEGEPNVKDPTDPASFTNTNSAVLKNTNGELFCGNFQGEIPADAMPKKFTIKLDWSIDDGTVVHTKEKPVEIIQQPDATVDSSDNGSGASDSGTPSSSETLPEESVTPPADASPDVTPAPEETTPTTPDTTSPDTATPETAPQTDNSLTPDSTPASSDDTTPVSFLEKTFIPLAHAEDIPAITTEEGAGLIPADTEVHSDNFFEVRYTLNGTDWKSLGMVSKTSWQNATFEISDSSIANWDDLSKLQVSLRTIPTIDTLPIIYVDSISFEVEYESIQPISEPPTIILKDASAVLEGDADFGAGDSPVFIVTDPGLTTEDINQLVKDDKAEIVEDKGKVLDETIASDTGDDDFSLPTPTGILNSLQQTLIDPFLNTDKLPVVPDMPEKKTPPLEVLPAPDTLEDAPPESSFDFRPASIAMSDFSPVPYFKSNRHTALNHQSNFLNVFKAKEALADDIVQNDVSARVLNVVGDPTEIEVSIGTVMSGGTSHPQITVAKPGREFRPGKYTLEVTLNTPQAVIVSKQDFTWGVLAINIDKSIYVSGDTAYLQMGVLNDGGHTLCGADLALSIVGPTGTVSNFNTDDDSIVRESQCGPDNVITVPDYYAHFLIPSQAGIYRMTLTATTPNGDKTIHDKFEVAQSTDFDVLRTGPTRIYPVVSYPMTIRVTSKNNWTGTIQETVPASFEISHPVRSIDYTDVSEGDGVKTISWAISLQAGIPKTIGYYFKAPPVSPEFYFIGPLSFYDDATSSKIFQEKRQWQIASDAVCTSNGGGGGTWSSGGTWSGCSGGGGEPDGTDDVTIVSGDTVTMDQNGVTQSLIVAGGGTLNTSNGTNTFTDANDFGSGSPDGMSPYGNVISVNGILYGMTSQGGAASIGMIFSVNPDGSNFTDLHDFNGTQGSAPYGSLIYSNGILYGMTSQGGANSVGVIFSLHIDGSSFTDIHDFLNTTGDGANPQGSLTIAGGILYGMTYQGGANNLGIAFSINIDGSSFTDIHDFSVSSSDGEYPNGSLIESAGVLYGMTYQGGASSSGMAFSMNTDGSSFTDIHDFAGGSTDGYNPYGDLLLYNGVLYGMASGSGAYGFGIAFSMNLDGSSFTDIHDFYNIGTDGQNPKGNLIALGGVLYGMTYGGGNNGFGIIFSMNLDGSSFTDLHDFNNTSTDGMLPYGSLTASGSVLYGMTLGAGANSFGVFFSLQTSWNLTSDTLDLSGGGALIANNSTITLNGTSGTLYDGGSSISFTPGGSTVIMDPEVSGSITLTAGKTDFYNLLVEKLTGVSPVLTFGSSYQLSIRNDFTMLADSKSDLNVVLGNFIDRATASTGKGTISMRNLYTSGSTVRLDTAGYDIETDNIEMTSANLALTEIVANASTITINKNWSLDAHATFTFDTSTVHLTSSETALVYGTITFKNLTIDNATAKAVYFYATGGTPTFTVGSVFTVTGHTSQLIKLYSSLPGTQWDFLPTAIATVDYADVKDGGCHAGAISIFPTNSVDSGNNGTCWGFAGGSVSGTVYLADETTPATTGNGGDCDGSTANVELRVNGGSPYTTTCSASDGTYTLSGLAASSGSYIAVYLTGTHKANAIYTTGGGADTGINLYYTVVTLSYSPSYSTIQIADMASYDSSTDATNMLFDATGTPSLTVNSSVTLQVDGGAGAEQFILDGNVTINHNLTNNGGIINPNGFTITGSGTNTLTNTNAGGAIYVDATTWAGNYASFETVTMAGNSFTYYNRIGAQTIDNSINYGVLYCAGSGTKSLGGGLTVQSYIGVSSGATVDTTGSNYSITAGFIQFYGGTFNANGSTITLTLSILSLSGGGTFNSGTSTVVMNYNNDQSITDTTTTFYNLTLSPTLTSVHTYTFGGPGTITINNNFTINPTSAGANALLVNMGGTITVAGTTTLTRTSNAVSILDTRPSGVDYDLTTGNLNIAAGGTLDASSSTSLITLNGTSGTLFTLNASGTFTPGTSVVQMTSDASVTLTSGAITFYNLYLNPTITASRAYTFGSGTLTINFAFNIQPNAASAFVLTVNMGGTINQSTNGVGLSRLGSATTTFNTNNNTLTSLSLLINSSSIFNAGSSTITLNGTTGSLIYTNSVGTGTFNPNTSTVIMNPNASLTLTSGTVAFYNLTLSPTITTARTYTFGSGVSTIGGNLNINPTSSGANALTVNMANALAITGTTTIQRTTSATANLDTISGSNYALTSGNLDIETGGTLTAQASALTLNGTSGTLFTLNGGTFTVGTSTMTISSNASVTLTSGAITFNALTLSPTITTARTYTFGSGALTINGNFGINPVSSGANLLTVNMGAAITVDITHGTSITATTSATSKLDTTGSNYALTSGYISMANSGTLVGNASTITVTSSAGASAIFDLQGTGVFTPGTSTVVFSQNLSPTLTSGATTFYNLSLIPTITAAKTYTFGAGAITVNNNFTINATSATSNQLTVNMGAAITVTGTMTIQGTTSGTALLDTRPSSTDYNLTAGFLNIASGGTLDCTSSSSVITLTGTSSTLFTRAGTFTQGTSTVTVTSASGTPTLMSGTATFHILTINAAATVVNAGANITTDNVAGNKLYVQSGVFNVEGTTVTPGTSGTLQIDSGGTLCLGGTTGATNATCDSGATQTSAIAIPAFTTFTFNSASTVKYLSDAATTVSQTPTYGNLFLTPKMTSARTYTLGGAMTINGNFDINPGTAANLLTVNAGGDITVASTKTTTIERTTSATSLLDLRPSSTDYNLSTGTLVISAGGTLDLTSASSTITVAGDWTNSGTFTQGTSSVSLTLANATTTVTGTTTFYNLTISNAAAREVDFATTSTPIYHVTNTFTVTGHAAALIKLYSTSGGTKWQFHPTGTAAVTYVDVKDGGCQSGAITISPTNSTDSGNNDSCWSLGKTLTFAVSSASVGLGTITTSAAATGSHTVSAGTNGGGGFVITYNGTTLTSGLNTIAAYSALSSSSPGTAGFGINLKANTVPSVGANPTTNSGTCGVATNYNTANSYTWIASTTTSITNVTAPADCIYTVSYVGNINSTTKAGTYSTAITYVISATF